MVAVVSGSGLGLFTSSAATLGAAGGTGDPKLGRFGDRVYVNSATGNLVVQSADERLSALGLDLTLVRTYNSQGLMDDENGDNWRLGVHQRVYGLTGTLNTAGSTIRKVFGDGADVLYTYNTTLGRYVSADGDGSHDTLSNSAGTWTWTDGSGRNTETYNASGQLTASRDADGNAVSYTYTGSLLTQITDASGQTTYLDYTGNNLTQIRVVSNSVTQTLTRYTYDASNRLTQVRVDLSPSDNAITDNNVYTTTYTYDGTSKRIASITQSDGSAVSFTYQSLNGQYRVRTSVLTNADGNRTTTYTYTSYNSAGAVYLQTDILDALGLTTSQMRDSAGRLTSVLSPTVGGARLETRFAYDAAGNVTSITEDPTGLNRVTALAYDTSGNLLSTRDSAGNTVTRTYNANNQVLTEVQYLVRDPDGAGAGVASSPLTTRYAYDAENHLRFAISADGRVTEYRYNAAGQRTMSFEYVGALYVAAPFAESDLATWAAAQNQTLLQRVDYAYDFRGNVSSLTAWAATTSAGAGSGTASITRFVYDQRGQLLQSIEARGEATTADATDYRTAYTYDGLGRLLTTTQWVSGTVTTTSTTSYDDLNRRTTTTLANGLISTSTYNQAGELISVINGASGSLGTTTYKYDAGGRLRITTDPTGVRQFFLYDEAGRKVAQVDGDGTLTEFIYNRASQLIKTVQYAALLNSTALATLVDASGNPLNPTLASLRTAAGGNAANDRITRNVYDAAGLLVYTIDEAGALTQFFYDGAGRVTDEVRYATPVTIARTVDQVLPGSFTVTTAATDRRTRNFYDNEGHLAATLDAGGYLVEYVYDAAGRLTQQIGYANQSNSTYWLTGTLAQLRPALDNETTTDPERDITSYFFYDGQGRKVGVLDGEGYLTESVYDVAGNVTQSIRYDRALTSTAGTSTFATLKTAAAGATTQSNSYQYDGAGRVSQETNYEGTITTYTYDGVGNLLSSTRAQGTTEARTTEARYDFLGRVTQELTAEGRALITGGMTQAQIDDIWSRYGVTYAYDLAGRKISATVRLNDSQTNVTRYYYDNDNRLRFEVNQLGERKEYRYNALNQLTDEITYYNRIAIAGLNGGLLTSALITTLTASADAARDARTSYTYALTGKVATITTAEGASTSYTYNAFGEQSITIQQIDASRSLRHEYTYDNRGLLTLTRWDPTGLNTTEGRTYDAFGRLTRVTDARNNISRIEYDRLGRQMATVDQLNGRRATTYDAFSRTKTTVDALTNTTTYAYNDTTRTMTVTTPEGIAITTVYNRHGQTLTVTAGGNTTTYAYNLNGQLTGISDLLGTLESRTYDRRGRQLTTTDGRGTITSFAYDAANRLLTRTVDSAGGGLALITSYVYDGEGRVDTVTEPNGRITKTTYDRDGRITQEAVDPSGLNIRTAYAYDRLGQVITVTEGSGSSAPRRTQYLYDTLGRRTEEIIDPTALGGTLNLRTQYRYDANGNLTRKIDANGNSTWYVYDAKDRVTHTVDALGGVTQTLYDAEDRVVGTRRYATAISVASFGDIVASVSVGTNTLDRLTQSVYDRNGREVYTIDARGGVTERTYDALGNVTRTRVYTNAIAPGTYSTTTAVSNALTAAGNSTSTLAASDRVQWTAYDVRGRARFDVDGSGAVVERQYDANGNVTQTRQFATLRDTALATTLASLNSWATSNAGNAQNRTTRYWYDTTDRLRFVADAEGYVNETRYNDAGRQDSSIVYGAKPTIAAGATLANVVTAVAAVANASVDQTTTTLTDAAGRVTRVTDALSNYEEYTYDAVGNKLTYRNQKGSLWTYVYDANGRVLDERSPQVSITTITDGGATLGSSAVTASIVTRMTYNALGNVLTRTEGVRRFTDNTESTAGSRLTSYTYDALGRQIRTTFPAVGVYNAGADDINRVGTAVVRTDAVQTLYSEVAYDTLGNAFRNRDVAGNYSYKTYDALGRVQYEVDALNYVTGYTYDAFDNQLTITRYAEPLSSAIANNTTSVVATDVTSRLTASSSQDRTITKVYDRLDRVTQVTQPAALNYEPNAGTASGGGLAFTAGATTLNEYDAFGQMRRTRQLLNPTAGTYADTYFFYDRRGLKVADVNALNYLTVYEYNDSTGDLTRQIEYARVLSSFNPASTTPPAAPSAGDAATGYDRITAFTYDRLNRTVSETKVGVRYNNADGTAATPVDVTTTYGYDYVGNQVTATVNGGTTYTYYDALGRIVALIEPSRNRGDGVTVVPLTLMRRDVYGNLVEQIQYANSASSIPDWTTGGLPTATANGADRSTKFLLDSHGHALRSEDGSGIDRFASYNARGEVAKEWQIVINVGDSTTDALVTVYEYDALGRQRVVREPQQAGVAPVVERQATYNAFGEVKTKTVSGVAGSETYEYDQAGRIWRTNAEDGVYKVYEYNLAGQVTAEIKAQFNAAGSVNLAAGSITAANALSTSGTQRVETRYDALGRALEQRTATFNAPNPTTPFTANAAVNMYGGTPHLTWTPPTTDFTLQATVIVDGVARTIVDLDGTEAGYAPGVSIAGFATGVHSYSITYTRSGDTLPLLISTGTFNLVNSTTTSTAITATAAVGTTNVSVATNGSVLSWTADTTLTSTQAELLINGNWTTLTVTGNESGVFLATLPALGAGTYQYRVTNFVNGRTEALATGSITIVPASSSTTTALSGLVTDTWLAIAPLSVSGAATPQASGGIAQSATPVATPILDESGQQVGTTYSWSGTNVVNAGWLDVGSQTVTVALYYRTRGDAANGIASVATSRSFTASGGTGASLSWTDASSTSGWPSGGISSIDAILVYDANGNLLRDSRVNSVPNTRLAMGAPADTSFGALVSYKPAGTSTWSAGYMTRSGSQFVLDLPYLSLNTYDFEIMQFSGSAESPQNVSTRTGQFVVSGSGSYVASQASPTPPNLSTVTQSGDRLYWSGTYTGGSVTVTITNASTGAVVAYPTAVTSNNVNFSASLYGLGSGNYRYSIRYDNGGTYLLGTGAITVTTTTTTTPASASATAGVNLGTVTGFTSLDSAGRFGWNTPANAGDAVVFKYRAAGGTTWSSATATYAGGYYSINLAALGLSGSIDYEVQYIATGQNAPYRVGGGTMTVTTSSSSSATITVTTSAAATTVTPRQRQTVDRWGNALSVTDPLNQTTSYLYNQYNGVVQITQPNVQVVSLSRRVSDANTAATVTSTTTTPISYNYYDHLGRLIGTRDANGNLNRATYNAANQVINETHADGGVKQSVYDAFGQVWLSIDEAGYKTRNQFDQSGRLTGVASEVTAGAISASDAAALPNFLAANVVVKRYGYDEAGRRISETTGEQTSASAEETLRYWYDLQGNVIRVRTVMGTEARYAYDAQGKKTGDVSAGGTWTYDYFGHLTGHVDMGGATYTYTYDTNTWLLKAQSNTRGQNQTLNYDSANHLLSIVDTGVGRTTEYRYDGAGRRAREIVTINGVIFADTRTEYDALGRTLHLSGLGYSVHYSYDAGGNRTRIYATYASTDYTVKTQDLWYQYDSMNRVTLSQGVYAGGTVNLDVDNSDSVTQGTALYYNTRGDRTTSATYGDRINGAMYEKGLAKTQYAYDGLGRLTQTALQTLIMDESGVITEVAPTVIDTRVYDRASRVVSDTTRTLESNQWVNRVQTTQYSDDGLVMNQATTKQIGSGAIRNESTVVYGTGVYGGESGYSTGYDAAGNVINYVVSVYKDDGSLHYTSTNQFTYAKYEGFVETGHTVTNSGVIRNGATSHGYNVNGELIQFTDSKDQTKNRYFANNAQGQPITVVKGNYGAYGSAAANQALQSAVAGGSLYNSNNAGYFYFDNNGNSVGSVSLLEGKLVANFDINYTPVSSEYPANVPASYTVQIGDTLKTIAMKVFGDASLWYVIAEANGLSDPAEILPEGRRLTIPNEVVALHNDANSFKPFDVRDAIGDTTPTQPVIPPPKKKGCGVLGMILVIIVAIVVTVYTAGAAAGGSSALISGAGGTVTTAGSTWAAGTAALSGGLVSAGGATLVGTSIAAAAVGGAVGSIASQGVAMALGMQDGFDWKSVALGAIGAGVGAGLGASSAFGNAVGSVAGGNPYIAAGINAVAGNAITQGVAVATGLQSSFNWKNVAVAAVSAPLAKYLGNKAGLALDANYSPQSQYASVGSFVSDVVGGFTSAGVRAAFGGKFEIKSVVADAFGNAIGNSIVGAMSFSALPTGLKDAVRALDNDHSIIPAYFERKALYSERLQLSEVQTQQFLETDLGFLTNPETFTQEAQYQHTDDVLRAAGALEAVRNELLADLRPGPRTESTARAPEQPPSHASVTATAVLDEIVVTAPRQNLSWVGRMIRSAQDPLVSVADLSISVGTYIEEHAWARWGMTALEIAAGPVAFAARRLLMASPIGDAVNRLTDTAMSASANFINNEARLNDLRTAGLITVGALSVAGIALGGANWLASNVRRLGSFLSRTRSLPGASGPQGLYNPRSIREDLEARYGRGNVLSTTVPPANARNVRLAGQVHPRTGIVFDERGYPIFDNVAAFDTRIGIGSFRGASSTQQMRMATESLAEAINSGQVRASQFSARQLRDITSGSPRISGFTWHHHQDTGRMQLVPRDIHRRTGHIGWEAMSQGR